VSTLSAHHLRDSLIGTVLVGGSPARVLRLTPAGARQVASWLSGTPVPPAPGARAQNAEQTRQLAHDLLKQLIEAN